MKWGTSPAEIGKQNSREHSVELPCSQAWWHPRGILWAPVVGAIVFFMGTMTRVDAEEQVRWMGGMASLGHTAHPALCLQAVTFVAFIYRYPCLLPASRVQAMEPSAGAQGAGGEGEQLWIPVVSPLQICARDWRASSSNGHAPHLVLADGSTNSCLF